MISNPLTGIKILDELTESFHKTPGFGEDPGSVVRAMANNTLDISDTEEGVSNVSITGAIHVTPIIILNKRPEDISKDRNLIKVIVRTSQVTALSSYIRLDKHDLYQTLAEMEMLVGAVAQEMDTECVRVAVTDLMSPTVTEDYRGKDYERTAAALIPDFEDTNKFTRQITDIDVKIGGFFQGKGIHVDGVDVSVVPGQDGAADANATAKLKEISETATREFKSNYGSVNGIASFKAERSITNRDVAKATEYLYQCRVNSSSPGSNNGLIFDLKCVDDLVRGSGDGASEDFYRCYGRSQVGDAFDEKDLDNTRNFYRNIEIPSERDWFHRNMTERAHEVRAGASAAEVQSIKSRLTRGEVVDISGVRWRYLNTNYSVYNDHDMDKYLFANPQEMNSQVHADNPIMANMTDAKYSGYRKLIGNHAMKSALAIIFDPSKMILLLNKTFFTATRSNQGVKYFSDVTTDIKIGLAIASPNALVLIAHQPPFIKRLKSQYIAVEEGGTAEIAYADSHKGKIFLNNDADRVAADAVEGTQNPAAIIAVDGIAGHRAIMAGGIVDNLIARGRYLSLDEIGKHIGQLATNCKLVDPGTNILTPISQIISGGHATVGMGANLTLEDLMANGTCGHPMVTNATHSFPFSIFSCDPNTQYYSTVRDKYLITSVHGAVVESRHMTLMDYVMKNFITAKSLFVKKLLMDLHAKIDRNLVPLVGSPLDEIYADRKHNIVSPFELGLKPYTPEMEPLADVIAAAVARI